VNPAQDQETSTLPAFRVDVVEPARPSRAGWERCEIGEQLQFSSETLQSYCFAPWEPVVFDCLLVAAAVEFCDREFKRPRSSWGREIRLRLPVHDPARWSSESVISGLVNLLDLLTGDKWIIEFRDRKQPAEQPGQIFFKFSVNARAVIPFSDGLDSRAVAAIESRHNKDSLIRVRVVSRVGEVDAAARGKPFTAVPYRVFSKKRDFRESSARSRGFKFAMIGGVAAYLAKVDSIVFPESGQGALGSALAPVGQAYPDYRNHPLFTRLMERFLAALLGRQLRYSFPRLWHTKGETLRAYIDETKDGGSLTATRSCWQGGRQVAVSGRLRQCGICAACMLRRMSINAAGLSEPQEEYVWENLKARTFDEGASPKFNKITSALREYAIAGALHLDHLADLGRSEIHRRVLSRKALQLSQCLCEPLPDVEARLSRLLRKHEEEWADFLSSLGPISFIRQWTRR
jgi:7-cyano-7-deazaguanine synthase in queuosine biosynthesis